MAACKSLLLFLFSIAVVGCDEHKPKESIPQGYDTSGAGEPARVSAAPKQPEGGDTSGGGEQEKPGGTPSGGEPPPDKEVPKDGGDTSSGGERPETPDNEGLKDGGERSRG
jgi:hypothetical protein